MKSLVSEACRLAFCGFEKNDRSKLIERLAEDVVFEFSDSLPYGGVYRGKRNFARFWELVSQQYEYFHYDAEAIVQAEGYIFIPVVARAKTRTGFFMENEHLFLFRVQDEMIIFGRIYADTARGRDVLEGRETRRYINSEITAELHLK